MRRVAIAGLVLLVLSASVIAGCGGSSESSSGSADLTLWTGFTDRELGVMKDVIADFEKTHPDIHVKVVGGISDDKIVAAIRGGNAPDVAHSFDAGAYTGAYCSNGAWIDLADYMKQDGLSDDVFPEVPRQYSQFEGTRCALPMLADVYGLYYNKDLLAKAGIDSPPQTVSQLMDDAKKLTERNPDGSLKVVGLDPFDGFYENVAAHWAPQWGVDWVDESGKSNLAAQPGWADMLRWQKELIDWYGYDNLVRWQASAGDEFSAQNAFERGKLAMNLDGEWRVAFVQSEHPELNFGTAPLPVDDAQPDLYGSGYTEREHHRHSEDLRAQGRGLAAPQIPGHGHGRARQDDERDPQRADDHGRARVTRRQAGRGVQHLPRHLREPEHEDDADHPRRQREPGPRRRLRDEVPGREGRRPRGRARRPRPADRRPARSSRRRAGAVR